VFCECGFVFEYLGKVVLGTQAGSTKFHTPLYGCGHHYSEVLHCMSIGEISFSVVLTHINCISNLACGLVALSRVDSLFN
jgi:hypothetical protein